MSVNEITLHFAAAMEKMTFSLHLPKKKKITNPYTSKEVQAVLFMTIGAHGKWIKIELKK